MSIGRSLRALVRLFDRHPWYWVLALMFMFVFYEIVFWSLNIGLAHYLISTGDMTLGEKLAMIPSSFTNLLRWPVSWTGIALFLVALLQGVSFAALLYLLRSERRAAKQYRKELAGTGVVGFIAFLGLGCIPCGTSLVTPLLTFFFASSVAVFEPYVATSATVLALLLSLLTLYLTGKKLHGRV